MARSSRTARARRKIRRSPISRSARTRCRSRPGRCRAPIAWPSTTSSCVSRRTSATWSCGTLGPVAVQAVRPSNVAAASSISRRMVTSLSCKQSARLASSLPQEVNSHLAGGSGMKLTSQQLEQFDREGYLFFPSLFTPGEIRTLTDEVPALYAQQRPENVREKTGDVVRTNFAAHLYSTPFARLARHPRMVEPIKQLFGEDVYMHQFKINGKAAFDGDVWQWHQDYGTWVNDDQMPEARAMNVAIFLDEVNEFNGPLMFISGSHKLGVLDAAHDTSTTSYPLWVISNKN